MQQSEQPSIFSQIHIDVARNATDDFNPFHDKNKWNRIYNNPFKGPIVLGFQLEALIEYKIRLYRQAHNEEKIITENGLRFSNYQISFANAVKPEHEVSVDIKKSQLKTGSNTTLSNRISIKSDDKLDLIGYKKESQTALFLPYANIPQLGDLMHLPDRSYLSNRSFFLKRKFMNTSNAKNFLSGSLAEQADYFDELEGKANFPEIFPCSLISCALLEKAINEKHDFERNPMVYTSHKISIDRKYLAQLKSNDALHILVKQLQSKIDSKQPGNSANSQRIYECYGIVGNNALLYRGIISLTPLESILNSVKQKKRGGRHI